MINLSKTITITNYAINRYIQRVGVTENPSQEIATLLDNGRLATPEEVLLIRLSRSKQAISLKGNRAFDDKDRHIVNGDLVFVINGDNYLVTLYEAKYLIWANPEKPKIVVKKEKCAEKRKLGIRPPNLSWLPNKGATFADCGTVEDIKAIWEFAANGGRLVYKGFECKVSYVDAERFSFNITYQKSPDSPKIKTMSIWGVQSNHLDLIQ